MKYHEEKLLYRALCVFGAENQIRKTFEELAEVQETICKAYEGRDSFEHLAEELADAQIMLDQIAILHELQEAVQKQRVEKLQRLARTLKETE